MQLRAIKPFMEDVPSPLPPTPLRFLDQLRQFIRQRHLAWATEKTYIHWVKRFIYFHGKRHPKDMGAVEVELFLTDLAVQKQCSPSTQATALNALVFMYREFCRRKSVILNFNFPNRTGVFLRFSVLKKQNVCLKIWMASSC